MKEGTCEPAEATKIQTDGERAQGDRQTEPERQGRTNTGWGGSRGRHGRYIPCGDAKARLEGGSVGGVEGRSGGCGERRGGRSTGGSGTGGRERKGRAPGVGGSTAPRARSGRLVSASGMCVPAGGVITTRVGVWFCARFETVGSARSMASDLGPAWWGQNVRCGSGLLRTCANRAGWPVTRSGPTCSQKKKIWAYFFFALAMGLPSPLGDLSLTGLGPSSKVAERIGPF